MPVPVTVLKSTQDHPPPPKENRALLPYLFQCHCHCSNGMVVGAALQRGEDCKVDFVLQVVKGLLATLLVHGTDTLAIENQP